MEASASHACPIRVQSLWFRSLRLFFADGARFKDAVHGKHALLIFFSRLSINYDKRIIIERRLRKLHRIGTSVNKVRRMYQAVNIFPIQMLQNGRIIPFLLLIPICNVCSKNVSRKTTSDRPVLVQKPRWNASINQRGADGDSSFHFCGSQERFAQHLEEEEALDAVSASVDLFL